MFIYRDVHGLTVVSSKRHCPCLSDLHGLAVVSVRGIVNVHL